MGQVFNLEVFRFSSESVLPELLRMLGQERDARVRMKARTRNSPHRPMFGTERAVHTNRSERSRLLHHLHCAACVIRGQAQNVAAGSKPCRRQVDVDAAVRHIQKELAGQAEEFRSNRADRAMGLHGEPVAERDGYTEKASAPSSSSKPVTITAVQIEVCEQSPSLTITA